MKLAKIATEMTWSDANASEEEIEEVPTNAPDQVRTSFIKYLRSEFPHGLGWKHPVTGRYFTHQEIKSSLMAYKQLNEEYYSCLWALWTTRRSRAMIAAYFHHSASTIKRRWKIAIDTVMLLLIYPELSVHSLKYVKAIL